MTQAQFNQTPDDQHVVLTCENHPTLRWICKKLAVSLADDGTYRYNHSRHIFFRSETELECDCPSNKLYVIIDD